MIVLGKYYWYDGPIVMYHKCGFEGDGIVSLDGTVCNICGTETPKNIMTAYKLWKWQRDK